MFVLTEERIDLNVFAPSVIVEATACQTAKTEDAQLRVLLLEDFIYSFYVSNKPVPDVVDWAAILIVERHGLININALCKELFISRRQLERKFLQKVGLSPKVLCTPQAY